MTPLAKLLEAALFAAPRPIPLAALEALDPDDPSTDEALIEELGDLLYQVEFHSTIAEQEGRFTIAAVAENVRMSRHKFVVHGARQNLCQIGRAHV